jgi:cation transport ATPase
MASKRASRKRRKPRSHAGAKPAAASAEPPPAAEQPRGYARGRAKDEAARAALVPLGPGERPGAVTVGAIAAALLAVANVVALLAGYESDEQNRVSGTLLITAVLVLVAYGMWRARYWAVLGMQTLLALTIIGVSIGLVTAVSLWGAVLLVLILLASGTLFWFLVKAMARIQMPKRPGS